jgi:hypothetical protein
MGLKNGIENENTNPAINPWEGIHPILEARSRHCVRFGLIVFPDVLQV